MNNTGSPNKSKFSVFHPERFHLLLYYSITSFIVIGIVSFLVGEIFSRIEKGGLIERSENYAEYIATNINHALYENFLFPTIKEYGYIDLDNNRDQLNDLVKVIKGSIYGLNLKKVYLFDMDGKIVYSTISEHIGYVLERGKNVQLDSAIKGRPASTLQHPGTKDSKGVKVEELLLESYYPVYEYSDGNIRKEKQTGVFEIYQNMNDLETQIKKAHGKAVIMTSSGMGILFLILLMIIKKASEIINSNTDQLVEARNHLEEKVEERTQQIKKTYKKLQETQKCLNRSEKLAGIGTLAAGVAHEINNPLASVTSCAEGLLDRLNNVDFKTNDDREVFPEYLKIICDETYRCKSITSKLLDFSRRHEPVFKKLEINHIISDVLTMAGRQTGQKKSETFLHLSPRPLIIFGDSNQLKQVFLNLILNAIDATKGEGNLTISTQKIDDYVQITFKDTGHGIKTENLEKIFEPFFTTKEPGAGTGLGLSICYGIIEEHKGEIHVTSAGIGRGSTFTITLPIHNGH